MKHLLLICLMILTQLGLGQSQHALPHDELMSVKAQQEDFNILQTQLKQVHPGLYTYTSKAELDAVFEGIESSLTKPISPVAFYRKLLPLLKPIGNAHTHIKAPPSYVDFLNHQAVRFPFRLYFRKDSLFVLSDASHEQSIEAGSLIQTINGQDAIELFHQMADLFTRDGYNTSYPNWATGYGFSRFFSYYIGTPETFQLDFIDTQGKQQQAVIQAITVDEINKNAAARTINKQSGKEPMFSFRIEDSIGIMTINSFQPEKRGPYMRFLRETFVWIEAERIESLILDLRDNGGGYPEAASALLRYLISEEVHPVKAEIALVEDLPNPEYYERDMFFKHFKQQKKVPSGSHFLIKGASRTKVKPLNNHFTGRLYVLIHPKTASAAGEFVGQVYSHCKATFIGEEAGGNPVTQVASDLLTLVLPHSGIPISLPAIQSIQNVSFENQGHGIIPEYEIIPTIQEMLGQEDVVLRRTLEKVRVGDW